MKPCLNLELVTVHAQDVGAYYAEHVYVYYTPKYGTQRDYTKRTVLKAMRWCFRAKVKVAMVHLQIAMATTRD